MKFLEKRIPPPLVGLLAGVAAWLVSREFAPTALPAGPRLAAAVAFVLLGMWLAGTAARTFGRAKTTLNPIKPEASTTLVTHGIFRRSRNPMYLGMASLLLAWAAWLGTPAGLLGPLLFVPWMNRFQIGPEERALGELFGAEYDAYRSRVRRWL